MAPIVICPACDLAHRRTAVPASGRSECARCRAPLQRADRTHIDTAISLALCALALLFFSNVFPLVAVHVNGSSRETTLIGAALGLHAQGYDSLAALVFLTTVIAPLLQILALLYVLIPLWRKRRVAGQSAVFRVLTRARPWSFTEVFILGALAALVRLSKFMHIVPGIALGSCVLLMICLSTLTSVTSPEQFWRWVERSRE
jgi:paraquat-inducible protein A